MDTSQYLSMFLEESMDNLQTLNESLLDLEQKPDDIDKLNEIFRVAHTIKGMAATMGFSDIAELTHKMEDVLSKFREGELKVTQNVVTVLFDCLDTLERMVNNISEGIEEKVEIDNIMKDLHDISTNEQQDSVAVDIVEEVLENKSSSDYVIDINEYDMNVIKQAHEKGYKAIRVFISLNENTLLKSARAFLIFKELEEHGEVIKSYPSTEDIENENFDFSIELIVITTLNAEEIEKLVKNISEVDKVSAEEVELRIEKVNETVKTKDEPVAKAEVNETSKPLTPKSIVTNKEKVEEKKSNNPSAQTKKVHQSVRVDLERLDKLMNMVSELVIHRTRLEQISTSYRAQELNETLEQVARTTSDLQDLVMKIRMLPLEVVFNRFPRMIRDLSVELNKEINFIVEGQDTELDRTVIDEIGEPLIHLLRNAADHGVESKEDRAKSGKDPVGTIRLSAYQEGTKAVIKVEDDGNGIDVEKVRRKAEKVGINTEGMTENDIKNLIFSQGFSTNEVVTDISGRGVGMDVVKTKISALGGTVDVVSEIGKGSSFIIRLPLTLQIIQALLVKVGEETLAISLGFIDRVIDYKEDRIKKTNGREVIVYRENVIPLIRLNETLQIDTSKKDKNFIIIVKVGDKVVGLLVDSLLGQQEIVIKPLGKTLEGLNEYIGATILGNGLVTLILDVGALI
ncbi:chemotaxis protein CheA [Clostridium folliculivorans]|uniref:Chemotaxis protein CheA n=1 Tax=Clostridium folliculivorans TaxID=2886038 RepID=A0A9W5XZ15_9CLOT|nr:chemotaxis protein CheA [Clostridium folliculivorans]GKU23545.1 chemotaxis protein CheA [Clostridium folliculivorans]GKU29661.1 chemotaxis protein CheA [Clostridium folliculivorans]